MKVLYVYAGNLFGGIETFLIALAKDPKSYLPELSMEFAIYFDGILADRLRANGTKVHILGNVKISRPWTAWQACKRLVAIERA
jgi:hypothetical protein